MVKKNASAMGIKTAHMIFLLIIFLKKSAVEITPVGGFPVRCPVTRRFSMDDPIQKISHHLVSRLLMFRIIVDIIALVGISRKVIQFTIRLRRIVNQLVSVTSQHFYRTALGKKCNHGEAIFRL